MISELFCFFMSVAGLVQTLRSAASCPDLETMVMLSIIGLVEKQPIGGIGFRCSIVCLEVREIMLFLKVYGFLNN